MRMITMYGGRGMGSTRGWADHLCRCVGLCPEQVRRLVGCRRNREQEREGEMRESSEGDRVSLELCSCLHNISVHTRTHADRLTPILLKFIIIIIIMGIEIYARFA